MKIIQSYLQGARHKAKNQPCEDRTYSLSENGVDVIALADGAGSKKYTHSADGAECVTKNICKFFCNNFDKFHKKEDIYELSSIIMTVCHRALRAKADEIGVDDIVKMSSTLLAVAVKDNRMIACHIGDGVIGKLTSKGTAVISAPDNGEFAGTTYFITNPKANEHIHIIKGKTDDVISYFLMSDGTQEYIYDEANGCFHDAARKMALLPLGNCGQKKLKETITEYMIDADSSSDDCSFICMLLNDEISEDNPNSVNKSDNFKNRNGKYDSIQNIIESFDKSRIEEKDINTKDRNIKIVSKNKFRQKKLYVLIIILVCVVIAVTVICVTSKKADSKSKQKILQSDVSSLETSSENDETVFSTETGI